jgi:hypothetical protein
MEDYDEFNIIHILKIMEDIYVISPVMSFGVKEGCFVKQG